MAFGGDARVEKAGWADSCDSLSGSSSSTDTNGKFEREYGSMPFGSRILVTIGGLIGSGEDIDAEIYLVPDYDVEQGMLSVEALKGMWGGFDNHGFRENHEEMLGWPGVIDLENLQLKRQIHEAISIVTIPVNDDDKEWVFKSLTRDQRYLYNELKLLLTLQPHENIIHRPRYIVTKKARFGGRRGVCGFILEYYTCGTLKQFLLGSSRSGITMEQKLLWARQVTSALCLGDILHIASTSLQITLWRVATCYDIEQLKLTRHPAVCVNRPSR